MTEKKLLHIKGMEPETIRKLDKQSEYFKCSRSELIRKICGSFVNYQEDARTFGKNNFFRVEQAVEQWIVERNEIMNLVNEIEKLNKEMQEHSQSSEVKVISTQIRILASMINTIHKQIL